MKGEEHSAVGSHPQETQSDFFYENVPPASWRELIRKQRKVKSQVFRDIRALLIKHSLAPDLFHLRIRDEVGTRVS